MGFSLTSAVGRAQRNRAGTGCPLGDLDAHPAFGCVSVSQSEDKVKAISSLHGPLMALSHVVQQDYFPKALAPLLLAFVTK